MSKRWIFVGSFLSKVFLNPAIDWSLRNNTQGYTGAYIRVRKSGTSDETDIFGVNNKLDVATMLAWADGANLRVVRIYNKGFLGSLFDLTQTVQGGAQPWIVRNGQLVTVNGEVAIDFSGGNYFFETDNYSNAILDKNSVMSSVFESQSGLELSGVIEEVRQGTTSQRVVQYSDTRNTLFRHSNYAPDGTGNFLDFPSQQPTNTQRQMSIKREGNTVEAYAENNLIDSLTSTAQFVLGNKIFVLGRQTAGNLFFNGKWQETLVDTDPTKRQQIDLNQINYYGV